jgi:hypothetical protein
MNILQPVAGFNYVGSGGTSMVDWAPSAAVLPRVGAVTTTPFPANGLDFSRVEPNTDILAVRRIEPPGERISALTQPTANPVIIEDDGDVTLEVDDFAVISNCEQASVFRVTGVADAGPTISLARDENTGVGSAIFQNRAGATLSDQNVTYGTATGAQGTSVSRLFAEIYYIAEGAGTNNRGQNTLALWRKSGNDAPVELIEGVQDLQLWFGVDTTPNDNLDVPNRYTDFATVGPNDVVRTVRIQITASTVDVIDPDANQPVTRTFSQTISLRNQG